MRRQQASKADSGTKTNSSRCRSASATTIHADIDFIMVWRAKARFFFSTIPLYELSEDHHDHAQLSHKSTSCNCKLARDWQLRAIGKQSLTVALRGRDAQCARCILGGTCTGTSLPVVSPGNGTAFVSRVLYRTSERAVTVTDALTSPTTVHR